MLDNIRTYIKSTRNFQLIIPLQSSNNWLLQSSWISNIIRMKIACVWVQDAGTAKCV